MALINELTNIGNAIRGKTGGTELIPLKEMASAIQGISSGGESKPQVIADSSISMVYPTLVEPAIVNVNDGITNADSSASLEE